MNEIEATEVTERDNLAVVHIVEALEPIPNKDRIELVRLKDCGYTTICEKGHKVGDLVVFVKYDTIVPDNELFAFMKELKFRVKAKSFTVRDENDEVVDKIYSQGIVLPLTKVYKTLNGPILDWDLKEGNDVTSELGVKKYIPPVKGSGSSFGQMQSAGDFPTHLVSKTDEMNLASKMRALEEIKGKSVYITQKLEGSSITFGYNDDEFFVCSRNNKLRENDNKFWQAINNTGMKEKLADIPDIIMQAELVGTGIQKNKLGLNDVTLYVFNMVEKIHRRRLTWDEMLIVSKHYGIPLVPFVCTVEDFNWTFEMLQKFADSQTYLNGELAEGIVIRPTEPFYSNVLKDIWSVKCINRDYKL